MRIGNTKSGVIHIDGLPPLGAYAVIEYTGEVTAALQEAIDSGVVVAEQDVIETAAVEDIITETEETQITEQTPTEGEGEEGDGENNNTNETNASTNNEQPNVILGDAQEGETPTNIEAP